MHAHVPVTIAMMRAAVELAVYVMLAATAVFLAPRTVFADEPSQKFARVGFVEPNSPSTGLRGAAEFWVRLRELGWTEGKNLSAENRVADGQFDRLPKIMADLVHRKVDLIVTYSTPAAVAAKNATNTIPIVVAAMGDPIGTGLASSLAHPDGNLTGISVQQSEELSGKWLELLQEAMPRASTIAAISDFSSPLVQRVAEYVRRSATAKHITIRFLDVRKPEQLGRAFQRAKKEAHAVLILPDPLTLHLRTEVVELAAKYRLPTMYTLLEFIDAGGLMAYGVDQRQLYRRAAEYADKVLRGARPSELPIQQATEFTLAINMNTARTLHLSIPQSILLRANEVIGDQGQ